MGLRKLVALALLVLAVLSPFGPAATAADDDIIRVGLVVGQAAVSAGSQRRALLADDSGYPLAYLDGEVQFTADPGGGVSVQDRGVFGGFLTVTPVAADLSQPNYVTVSGSPYRGELRILAAGGLLTVVNAVPLEDYLLGVVPREMPADFPLEALKAQAVAARTYALYARAGGAYASQGFDLLPTTASQVYGGVRAEYETTSRAVRETAGEVVLYGGRPIGAYFHSSSGGHTESVEYVWGFPSPYLKGVRDYDQDSPHYTWSIMVTREDLSTKLAQAGYDAGGVLAVETVGDPGPGGRYLERRLVGSAGEVVLRSEKLRSVLGLRSAFFTVRGEEEHLADVTRRLEASVPCFAVAAGGETAQVDPRAGLILGAGSAYNLRPPEVWVVSRELVPASFTFDGHGWGHGVGLSQWGARGMALQGKSYREILTHYYTGVTVGTLP